MVAEAASDEGSNPEISPQYEKDDIRVEYHPHSGIPTKTVAFEDFTRDPERSGASMPNAPPYRPWRTQEDFELSELALEVAMNESQIERLIQLVHRCADKPGSFTLKNHADYRASWERASMLLTPVSKHTSHAPLYLRFR